ncbi:hypothetical protein EMPS_09942 [Entomortierella parvispora]|uniref:NACHT domain-containing protein n=1 Tax=Entomortierella parvispora TaxID=205924 RepID=A0A9P3HJI6_9FUNG|nr:hypothetical protein EMPS_09942 [Entomortierella parvispora]
MTDRTKRLDVLSFYSIIRNAYSFKAPEEAHQVLEANFLRYGGKDKLILYIDGGAAVEKEETAKKRKANRDKAAEKCYRNLDALEQRITHNQKASRRHFVDVKKSLASLFYWPSSVRQDFIDYLIKAGWTVRICETEADVAIAADCRPEDIVISADSDMLAYGTIYTLWRLTLVDFIWPTIAQIFARLLDCHQLSSRLLLVWCQMTTARASFGLVQSGRRRRNDDGAIYIEPMSKLNLKTLDEDKLEPMRERVQSFIQGKAKVLLILRESGSGKSTFNRRLEFELWNAYKPRERIPLFIDLKTIADDRQMVKQHLTNLNLFSKEQIAELRKKRQFILICDGYDECRSRSNLYDNNNLNGPSQWKAKMVVSCRSQYLGLDYRTYFQPHANEVYSNSRSDKSELLEEAAIVPFKQEQIQNYVEQYIASPETEQSEDWTTDRYMDTMKEVPHLADLVTNPFLLRIVLDTLPGIVESSPDLSKIRVSRVRLYDAYIFRHFHLELRRLDAQISQKKLKESEEAAFEGIRDDFVHDGIHYSKRLAAAIFRELGGVNSIEYVSTADFKTSGWMEEFFSMDAVVKLRRESGPLVRSGSQYRFAHRSILEYFFSCLVFEPRNNSIGLNYAGEDQGNLDLANFLDPTVNPSLIANHPFGLVDLVSEPSILHFLVERVRQSTPFKEQLDRIIRLSKIEPAVGRASANAITILVKAGVLFNGVDIQGIRIPGADLSEGQFDSAQIQGADLTGHSGHVGSVAISNDSLAIVSGGEDRTVRTWHLEGDNARVFQGHEGTVCSVAFAPHCGHVVSASNDSTARVWDIETGSCVHILKILLSFQPVVAWSPCGRQIVTGTTTLMLWNAETGELERILAGEGAHCVAYSRKGKLLAGSSSKLTIWNLASDNGDNKPVIMKGTSSFQSAVFSQDEQTIAKQELLSASQDGTIRFWQLDDELDLEESSFHAASQDWKSHRAQINSLVYGRDSSYILSAGNDDWFLKWNTKTGSCNRFLKVGFGATMVISPSCRQLVVTESWGDLKVYQLGGIDKPKVDDRLCCGASQATFSSCGEWMATSKESNDIVSLWNVRSGKEERLLEGKAGPFMKLAFSPDSRQLISLCLDQTIQLWDIERASCTEELDFIGYYASFSPCGRMIAILTEDSVRLWDLQEKRDLVSLEGLGESAHCIEWSPCGGWIAAGCEDGTVHLWRLFKEGSELKTANVIVIQDFLGPVRCLIWSPLGPLEFATGCDDGSLCLWRIVQFYEGGYRAQLVWGSLAGRLTATGARVDSINGLTNTQKDLLIQRGAIYKVTEWGS